MTGPNGWVTCETVHERGDSFKNVCTPEIQLCYIFATAGIATHFVVCSPLRKMNRTTEQQNQQTQKHANNSTDTQIHSGWLPLSDPPSPRVSDPPPGFFSSDPRRNRKRIDPIRGLGDHHVVLREVPGRRLGVLPGPLGLGPSAVGEVDGRLFPKSRVGCGQK